jgi:UDP-glucose 4-epimerase
MQKLVLVTGGAGFIGSNLCERLLAEGYKVISLDNYSAGLRENHIEGVDYREGDTKDIAELIPETPDLIYHLGEYSRVEQSFVDVDKVMDYNVVGTAAVLEFWRQKGSKLVYAGSSTKYAHDGDGRLHSPYAWTKASNTELVKRYSEWFGLSYAITYFYNVYGPRERSNTQNGTLIAIFADKHKRGELLSVRLPGTQKRNFTHVDDIVDGLILVGQNGTGDEYGLGHLDAYSVLEVAEMFGGEVEMLEARAGNRSTSGVDIDRAYRELGWKPKRNLPEYIEKLKNS